MSFQDRLIYIIDSQCDGNKKKFSDETGIPYTSVVEYTKGSKKDPKLSLVNKVITTYENVNAIWLLGLDSDRDNSNLLVAAESARYGTSPKVVSVDPANNENICLVDVKAAAGYTQNVSSEEYVRELPVFNIPIPNFQHGSFRAFQVDGDSMEPTLFSNDWVIARSIESFEQIREGYVHVLVARSGIIVKRLLNRAKVRQKIVAQSDNNSYSTYEVELDDILEIWAVSAKLSTNLSNISRDIRDQINDLTIEMMDIRNEISQLKSKSP